MPRPIAVIAGVRIFCPKYLLNAASRSGNSKLLFHYQVSVLPRQNETATCMKITTLIWKIDLLVLT